jgi:hypothetical protein
VERNDKKLRKGLVVFIGLGLILATGAFAAAQMLGREGGNPAGRTRTYYIAADEVEWDYAPLGIDAFRGEPFGDEAKVFVENNEERIGRVYIKALYREYTDESFTVLKPIPPQWEHLGTLGPVIRASVGDTIEVVFKNNARFPFSVHPHGVFYLKDSEGAPYDDGTEEEDKMDDAVPPGGVHTYRWEVPDRAGPAPGDPSSVLWMYHSHTDEAGDTNAGLVGPLIVSRLGAAGPDGVPRDVARELVTLFTVFDENRSPYLLANIEKYIIERHHPDMAPEEKEAFIEGLLGDDDFIESNLMHGINGFVFGNLQGLDMRARQTVRWYLLGMGTEVDLHTPHWHGQTGTSMGMRTDVVELMPGSMKMLDMVPDNPGVWLYHCHVNDHIDAGMLATFKVES